MKIDRIERYKVCDALNGLQCDACRNSIETYYIYTLLFTPNDINGKYAILCEDCVKELKATINKTVDEVI